MQDFRKLNVWEKSHSLAVAIYQVTATYPKEELFGLTSQIRRAGVSIPANIAEGCGRGGNTELGHFFQIAVGSASELEYHLLLSRDLKILNEQDFERLDNQVNEVKRMLISLIKKVKIPK